MSYTVLAIKWRPKRFEALLGQEDVVRALVNSLAAGRLHHAYLFSGTRGVGKTTVARILAKALNCESGVSAEPCGECAACVAIDEGRFVDLIEVDAASRTRVDDTRELLDNVQYMPTRGRFKVYLIDEVHMLSTHSFNALLKTLEEPPPHVKFLFATTDPQKLPVTVLSRCLQFNLKRLKPELIASQLETIAESEGVTAETLALAQIARSAEGSMRDALSLLDQAIAFGAGAITLAEVSRMLGSIDPRRVTSILEALARADGAALLDAAEDLEMHGSDFGDVLDEVMAALQRIAANQLVGDRAGAESSSDWGDLGTAMTPEEVQLYYQIALGGRRDIGICRDQRMSFEMTLLRMLAFRPDRAEGTPAQLASGASTKSVPKAGDDAVQRRRISPADAAPEPSPQSARQPEPASGISNALDWKTLVRDAGLRGAVRNLAEHCELAASSDHRLELVLARDNANFNTEQLRDRLEQALCRHLNRDLKVKIEIGQPPRATPAEVRQANEDEQMRRAREAIEQDPNILAVQAAFDAVLEPDSIQPAGSKG